jgi:hypothetical protein
MKKPVVFWTIALVAILAAASLVGYELRRSAMRAAEATVSSEQARSTTDLPVHRNRYSNVQRIAPDSPGFRPAVAKFNQPDQLALGKVAQVELVLSVNLGQDMADLFENLEGKLTERQLQVGDEVTAILSAPKDALEIAPRFEAKRSVSSLSEISWIWDVRPLKPGKVFVTLDVLSEVKGPDGKSNGAQYRALQESWEIQAHGLEWVKYQIASVQPIAAAIYGLAGVLTSVLAFFGIKSFRKGSDRPSTS